MYRRLFFTSSICAFGISSVQCLKKSSSPEWAYPSPYDNDIDSSRFSNISHLRKTKEEWDLQGIVDHWKANVENNAEEVWPWVWTWHNPKGPHYIFAGIGPFTLASAQRIAEANPNHNLTLILQNEEDEIQLRSSGGENAFYKARCAIIKSPIRQIDIPHKIIMLEDERILCFDELHVR